MSPELVKLKNTLPRTFNRVKPNGTINVEKQDVAGYLANGFVLAEVSAKEAEKAKKAQAKSDKAEAKKAEDEAKKAEDEAREQAEAQAKLDAEHAENNKKDEDDGDADADADATNAQDLSKELDNVPTPKKNGNGKK